MNLRGFKAEGIGPRADRDSLGGKFFHCCSAYLSTPFPLHRIGNLGCRLFGFANTGALCNQGSDFISGSSVSAGVGVFAPTPVGRLEASYSKIIRKGKLDATQPMQIGLSLNFG